MYSSPIWPDDIRLVWIPIRSDDPENCILMKEAVINGEVRHVLHLEDREVEVYFLGDGNATYFHPYPWQSAAPTHVGFASGGNSRFNRLN